MSTSSARKIESNRANAQLSTGPASVEGKAKVSLNAVKTGLTGRTVLLPADDVEAYEALLAEFTARHQPATPEEQRLTQSLADTEWRLLRIPELEAGIYALAYRDLADAFADIEDPRARRAAIQTQIYRDHERELRNLGTQESRLRRQREKDAAALSAIQAERKLEAKRNLTKAAASYIKAIRNDRHESWDPQQLGFEFSMAEITDRAMELDPALFFE